RRYVERWPRKLRAAGARTLTRFSSCVLCGAGSWMAYGPAVLCRMCAWAPTTPLRLRYRAALLRCWAVIARSGSDTEEDKGQVINEVRRLLDEVGEPTATRLRLRWARSWSDKRQTCPTCGGREFHEPARKDF